MSKLGRKPVLIKEGVTVVFAGGSLLVNGPKGELKVVVPGGIDLKIGEKTVEVKRLSESKQARALHGTVNRLVTNAIAGVTSGFQKTLEVVGTGYRAVMEGEVLVLSLGFSHLVRFPTPAGVGIKLEGNNKIIVTGLDKQRVGLVADQIRRLRPPDPYKGKGLRYEGERLRLKPGKAAAKTGGAGGK